MIDDDLVNSLHSGNLSILLLICYFQGYLAVCLLLSCPACAGLAALDWLSHRELLDELVLVLRLVFQSEFCVYLIR